MQIFLNDQIKKFLMKQKNIVISFLMLFTLLVSGCSYEQANSNIDYSRFESKVNNLVLPEGFTPLNGAKGNELEKMISNVQSNFPNYNVLYANIWTSEMDIKDNWELDENLKSEIQEVTEVVSKELRDFIQSKEGIFKVGETTFENWPEETGVQKVGTWQVKTLEEDLILWEAKMIVSNKIFVTITQVEIE